MTAGDLLQQAHGQGVTFYLGSNGKLRFRGQRRPGPDLLAAVREHHQQVVDTLRREAIGDELVRSIDAAGRPAPPVLLAEVDRAWRTGLPGLLEAVLERVRRWAETGHLPPPAVLVLEPGAVLRRRVVVVESADTPVPDELAGELRFTWQEVHRLRDAPPAVVQACALVKDTWPTTRVVHHGAVVDEEGGHDPA